MAFEGMVNGNKIMVDAEFHVGDENPGARPKSLMLLALGGCTGIDVDKLEKALSLSEEKYCGVSVVINR